MITNKKSTILPNETKILFILLFAILTISCLWQFSVSGGEISTQFQNHCMRILFGICTMLLVCKINFRHWSNLAYIFYGIVFLALIIVELLGIIKLGAQRWINLYFFTFQPSEIMKLALVLAIAKYYSTLSPIEIQITKNHYIPIALTLMPSILILKQPDLGTAVLLFSTGFGMIYLSGFPIKAMKISIASCILLIPVGWFFLHDYQKNRILTFISPGKDPLGAGYHVLQSKIAIGSGHIFGMGFLQGTQGKLNFLPEKNTDFIFTTIAEEAGFLGASAVVILFVLLTYYFLWAGSSSRNNFSRLMCHGFAILLFLHSFVNIAMVMGIAPVVGIPLPFLSYGGSAMMTFMISCGLVISSINYKKNH